MCVKKTPSLPSTSPPHLVSGGHIGRERRPSLAGDHCQDNLRVTELLEHLESVGGVWEECGRSVWRVGVEGGHVCGEGVGVSPLSCLTFSPVKISHMRTPIAYLHQRGSGGEGGGRGGESR